MKKREILSDNGPFILVKQTRDHKTWYEIQVFWRWAGKTTQAQENELLSHFGKPTGRYGLAWRFWNRNEALKQYTYATLRWG